MNALRTSVMMIACLAAGAGTAAADKKLDKVQMTEGMWEMTGTMTMAGQKMPATTTSQCITKKDLVPSGWMKDMPPNMKCDNTHSITASTVTWKMSCKMDGGATMKMDGKITYSGKRFTGSATVAMKIPQAGDQKGSMTMSGKYTGPCKAEK